jgi:uncharacterized protein
VKNANIPGETTAKLINVSVKPNCPKSKIISHKQDSYEIELNAPALKNKANVELIKLLSRHFKCRVRIKSGHNSRKKRVIVG